MIDGLYATEIRAAALAYGLDADLVSAVVEQESGFSFAAYRFEPGFWHRYLADNPAYAHRRMREVSASYGLMQIMFPTAVEHGFTGQPWELFAPTNSLAYGCRHLASLLAWARGLTSEVQVDVTRTALAAYNAGKGGVHSTAGQRYAAEVVARLASRTGSA